MRQRITQSKSRKRKSTATVKLRTNGKHKVDAKSTVVAPIPYSLQRILRPQAQYRWLYPALAAITPQYIETTLNGAMAGYNVQQWWLFDLMLKTWPELLACYTELVQGVMRKKLIFEPYHEEDEQPSPDALDRLKVVSTALHRMEPDPNRDDSALEGTIQDLLDGWFRGLTVSEIVWQPIDDKQVGTVFGPKATFFVDPSNYAFDINGTLGLRPDRGSSSNRNYPFSPTGAQPQPSQLEQFPDHKFLIAMHKSSAGNVLGGPLLRPLAWWWCAANFSSDWLLNLAQVFGLPFRWANYDANAPQGTVDSICNMLQNMGSAGWAAFPIPTTLEMIQPGAGQGSDHSPQGELLDRADRYCRNLILGQTMTGSHGTTGKGGGQAFGKIEKDVKEDRIDAAGKFAANVINRQLVMSILILNYGNTDEAPRIKFLEDEVADLTEAQRDKTLADAGLEIGVDYLRKKYDIPEPAEGEDTIGGEKPMPPGFGGFGQDFGGSSDGTGADTAGEPPDVKASEGIGHPFHGNQYVTINDAFSGLTRTEAVKSHLRAIESGPLSYIGNMNYDAAQSEISKARSVWQKELELRRGIGSAKIEIKDRNLDNLRHWEAREGKQMLPETWAHNYGIPEAERMLQGISATEKAIEGLRKIRTRETAKQAARLAASDQTGHPFRGNQYVSADSITANKKWDFSESEQIGQVTQPKPGLWKKAPGDFTAASQAAAYYAKKQGVAMQIVPGNSYGHKIYHIRAIHEDAIGQAGSIGDQFNIAIVHPDGKVFQVKATRKTKIPHDTSNFPSLLQSEENKRRAQLNAKLLELNAIEDDAVFSRELSCLADLMLWHQNSRTMENQNE